MAGQRVYPHMVESGSRTFLANGFASWLARHLPIDRRFLRNSSSSVAVLSVGGSFPLGNPNGRDWLCSSTKTRPCPTLLLGPLCDYTPTRSASGGGAGLKVSFP
jgi:hypothetical protein